MLEARDAIDHWKARGLDFSKILYDQDGHPVAKTDDFEGAGDYYDPEMISNFLVSRFRAFPDLMIVLSWVYFVSMDRRLSASELEVVQTTLQDYGATLKVENVLGLHQMSAEEVQQGREEYKKSVHWDG